jgi:hypothetical protein
MSIIQVGWNFLRNKTFIITTDLFIESNVHSQNSAEVVDNINVNLIILKVKIVSTDWFFQNCIFNHRINQEKII